MASSPASPIARLFVASVVAALPGAFLLTTGCARQVVGTARAEPPPHVFPDLAQFTQVDSEPFYTASRGGPIYQFSTTVGVQCTVTFGVMSCGGRFSTEPYSANDNPCASVGSVRTDGRYTPGVYTIERSDGTCKATAPRRYPRLEAGHKMVLEFEQTNPRRFTCAVGPPERIACINLENHENHGYVIEPTGAWTF